MDKRASPIHSHTKREGRYFENVNRDHWIPNKNYQAFAMKVTIVLGRVNTFIEEQLAKYLDSGRNSDFSLPLSPPSSFSLIPSTKHTTCFYGPINYVHKMNWIIPFGRFFFIPQFVAVASFFCLVIFRLCQYLFCLRALFFCRTLLPLTLKWVLNNSEQIEQIKKNIYLKM